MRLVASRLNATAADLRFAPWSRSGSRGAPLVGRAWRRAVGRFLRGLVRRPDRRATAPAIRDPSGSERAAHVLTPSCARPRGRRRDRHVHRRPGRHRHGLGRRAVLDLHHRVQRRRRDRRDAAGDRARTTSATCLVAFALDGAGGGAGTTRTGSLPAGQGLASYTAESERLSTATSTTSTPARSVAPTQRPAPGRCRQRERLARLRRDGGGDRRGRRATAVAVVLPALVAPRRRPRCSAPWAVTAPAATRSPGRTAARRSHGRTSTT